MEREARILIDQLTASTVGLRRSAARKLWRGGMHDAGSYILEALALEMRRQRTWSTQFEMIIALGELRVHEALPFLEDLSKGVLKSSVLYYALGEAIVLLRQSNPKDVTPLIDMIRNGFRAEVIHGALQWLVAQRITPSPDQISEMIGFANRRPIDDPDGIRVWTSAAAAGWEGIDVVEFLEKCALSTRPESRAVAVAALAGRYGRRQGRWNGGARSVI